MTIEEYLLFALAVVYFMISNGNHPREHRATRWNNQDSRSSIDPGAGSAICRADSNSRDTLNRKKDHGDDMSGWF